MKKPASTQPASGPSVATAEAVCLAQGCTRTRTGPSGYCGEHFAQGGRDRARERERAVLSDPDRDWYTADEAARICGVFPATIRDKIQRGELPGEKVGRHWRIPKEAVDELGKRTRRRRQHPMPTRQETEARRQEVRTLCEKGLPIRTMVKTLGVDKSTIYSDLAVLGLDPPGNRRPGRTLTAEQLAELPSLYGEGQTLAELGSMYDVAPGQVRDALDKLGIARRPAGTRPKYPRASERPCAHCETPFTPSQRDDGGRTFCKPDCANAALAAARKEALLERGLLGLSAIAARAEVTTAEVAYWIRECGLPAERVTVPGWRRFVWGVHPDGWHRFELGWVRGQDGRRRSRWQDVATEFERRRQAGEIGRRAAALGISSAEAEDIVRGRLERRRKQLARRCGGRKPGSAPPDQHLWQWQARYEELEHEMLAAWEREKDDQEHPAGKRPTRHDVFAAVAEEDWREHPHRWSRDGWPASRNDADALDPKMRSDAAKNVRNGLKRLQKYLQSVGIETQAA